MVVYVCDCSQAARLRVSVPAADAAGAGAADAAGDTTSVPHFQSPSLWVIVADRWRKGVSVGCHGKRLGVSASWVEAKADVGTTFLVRIPELDSYYRLVSALNQYPRKCKIYLVLQ